MSALGTAPVVSRKVDQTIDGLGELRRAPRAVTHLAGDEARVDRARAHDPGQCCGERPRAGPARIGDVEHHEVGIAPERRSCGGKAADKGRVLGAFEQIARRDRRSCE